MSTEFFRPTDFDREAIRVAKALAADAVETAGSGHPGTAISLAPLAYLLYQYEMTGDPGDTGWLGRDRFVLSAGHASVLQYIQLVMAGYGLEVRDLEQLRRAGSATPGHPELGHTPGVETTTGPLGAGLSNAVGMAMAARFEHGLLDPHAPAGGSVFDHFIYVVMGDGCMQEGVVAEAASLAGTQRLGNLIAVYDDNDITIEGSTDLAFTEDVSARFAAYGWQVIEVDWRAGDRYEEDLEALHEAFVAARAETGRPTLIRLRTIIAWPAPTKQGTAASHGAALGADEVAGLKRALGLDPEEVFQTAGVVERAHAAARAAAARRDWDARYEAWRAADPERAALLDRLRAGRLPEGVEAALPVWEPGAQVATRNASGAVLTALADVVPELWGGSADLGGSNKTTMGGQHSFLPRELAREEGDGPYGRVIHFGVREHAMGGVLNGIALDGLTRAYGGTFLVFADYMRPAVRLAALMGIPTVFVWSHDSIGVGEDGPTHQPIEHLASLRAIPGLDVIRPADANETAAAWDRILHHRHRPAGIILSRQNLPVLTTPAAAAAGAARGAYILIEAADDHDRPAVPTITLIATGSEVSIAADARTILQAESVPTRVVSAPCLEWFDQQDEDYRARVLPPDSVKVSIEAGIATGWRERVGHTGAIISIDHYGASAPAARLFADNGFTGQNIAATARRALARA